LDGRACVSFILVVDIKNVVLHAKKLRLMFLYWWRKETSKGFPIPKKRKEKEK
jgi:hypothetical protein